ncbi:MAG: galactose-1-epimerase, partial [Prevotellaceae bacterium]|nr:galactose-1-epimerase [Prevotellaceae bacterium]
MKSLLYSIVILCLAACTANDALPLLDKAAFETTVDGKNISLYTLKSGNGVTMQVTNFGARVISIWAPDKNGKYDDIAIG